MLTELNDKTFVDAIAEDGLSVVELWAGWCMPCKIFAPIMLELSEQMDGKAKFYKLNIDNYSAIAQKYNITSIPTVLLFRAGEVVDESIGVRGREDMTSLIEKHL